MRSEAQIRAEQKRAENTVTVSLRLTPLQAELLDEARGEASRMAYATRAVVRSVLAKTKR